jgi:hypothetical protein
MIDERCFSAGGDSSSPVRVLTRKQKSDKTEKRFALAKTKGEKLMGRPMDLDKIRTVIDEALSVYAQGIQCPVIDDAAIRKAAVSSEQLQQIAARIEYHDHGEITLSAEVELFLRVSNTAVLSSIERMAFRVKVSADHNDLRAVASNEKDCGEA